MTDLGLCDLLFLFCLRQHDNYCLSVASLLEAQLVYFVGNRSLDGLTYNRGFVTFLVFKLVTIFKLFLQ